MLGQKPKTLWGLGLGFYGSSSWLQNSKELVIPQLCLPPWEKPYPISAGNCPGTEITQGIFPSRLAGKILTSPGAGKPLSVVRLWGSIEPQARPAHPPRYQLLHQTPTQRELVFSDGGFKGHHRYLVTQTRPCWGQGSLPEGGLGRRGCLVNMTWLLGPSSMLWSICPFDPFPKLCGTKSGPLLQDPSMREMAI